MITLLKNAFKIKGNGAYTEPYYFISNLEGMVDNAREMIDNKRQEIIAEVKDLYDAAVDNLIKQTSDDVAAIETEANNKVNTLVTETSEAVQQLKTNAQTAITDANTATTNANTAANTTVPQAVQQMQNTVNTAVAPWNGTPTVSVSTLEPGAQATATVTKNADNVAFAFALPKGDKGDKGDNGTDGHTDLEFTLTDGKLYITQVV